jgi:hypothetical protein
MTVKIDIYNYHAHGRRGSRSHVFARRLSCLGRHQVVRHGGMCRFLIHVSYFGDVVTLGRQIYGSGTSVGMAWIKIARIKSVSNLLIPRRKMWICFGRTRSWLRCPPVRQDHTVRLVATSGYVTDSSYSYECNSSAVFRKNGSFLYVGSSRDLCTFFSIRPSKIRRVVSYMQKYWISRKVLTKLWRYKCK